MLPILELPLLTHLTDEFRLSMRRLLHDLCRELQTDYPALSSRLELPVGLFQLLSRSLEIEHYSGWKVAGWIETLNDLVYFLDILQQWEKERDRREFTEQLFAECQEKFFENSYLADLFPSGRPIMAGLEARLIRLCNRLAQEVTQESLFFDPARTVKWFRQRGLSGWRVRGTLEADFERAERQGTISVGTDGAWCEAPTVMRAARAQSSTRVTFLVEADGIAGQIGRATAPLWARVGAEGNWIWSRRTAPRAVETAHGTVTVGPTLVYGNDRNPREVRRTEEKQIERIRRAWRTIQAAWPEGCAVLELLTSRIVPLKAKGVVSFSYRHRPGLSFINCFDRDNLDLIDDLIHENSHHHLNLLLRKYVMYHGDHNQQIFYSPWRRSLRPLRGILHATFTFTMGAMLFERLSAWASGPGGAARWKNAGLTLRDLERARFRCLEEVESVRHSLQDLHYADHHLGWLTGSGCRLVGQLEEAIGQVERDIDRFKPDVLGSKFGLALRRHISKLKQARLTYGPMRLSEV
jgi:HEXXH motif-containing protein